LSGLKGFEDYASRAPLFLIVAVFDGNYITVSWGQGVKCLFSSDFISAF